MAKTRTSAPPAESAQAAKKRTRLAPELRQEQILQAALAEFSAHGYAATSIARIAARAGISKANVYVHFASKEAVFEVLVRKLLSQPKESWDYLREVQDIGAFVDRFVDAAYDAMTPETVAIIRMMIADGYRLPQLREQLGEGVFGLDAQRQEIIDTLVANGRLVPSPITEHFSLALTPFLYAAVSEMVLGPEQAKAQVAALKSAHKKLLHALLRAPA